MFQLLNQATNQLQLLYMSSRSQKTKTGQSDQVSMLYIFFLLSLMLQDNKLECLTVASHFRITQYFLNNYSSLPISLVIVRCTERTQKILNSLFKNRNTVAYFSAKSVTTKTSFLSSATTEFKIHEFGSYFKANAFKSASQFALGTCPVKLFTVIINSLLFFIVNHFNPCPISAKKPWN